MTANDNLTDDTLPEPTASLARVTWDDHISEFPAIAAITADIEERLTTIGA